MNVLWHMEPRAGVPPSAVEDQHNLFARTGTDFFSKRSQFRFKERDRDRGGQVEDGATRGGVHTTDEVAPLVAVLDRGEGALAVEAPDLLQDRLQSNPMFVHRPEFS